MPGNRDNHQAMTADLVAQTHHTCTRIDSWLEYSNAAQVGRKKQPTHK